MYMLNRYESYLGTVTEQMERLRARALGQLHRLEELVPNPAAYSAEQLAERMAQVLVLLVARVENLEAATLRFYRQWLETVCLFLLETCPEEDHTFYSILKVCALEPDVFFEMIEGDVSSDVRHTLLHPPEGLGVYLEEAVWYLMDQAEKQERMAQLQGMWKLGCASTYLS